MTQPIRSIEFRDVSFKYADAETHVFRNLDLQIDPGHITIITGENGTGKSTLGLLLAGALQPTDGRILIDGEDINHAEKKPGYLHQNPENQIIGLTCERDIAYGLENRGVPREIMRRKIRQVVEVLEIDHIRTKPVNEISGGEKQRVALAGMLVMGHPYLILDEPTSYLDYPSQKKLYQLLMDLYSSGTGILWITQYLSEQIIGDDIYEITTEGHFHKIVSPTPESERSPVNSSRVSQIPADEEDIVTIRNLRFKHAEAHEFGINCEALSVPDNSITGWYGYSGSGKTTLAKLVAGILTSEEPAIETDLSPVEIIYLPQFAERFLYSADLEQTFEFLSSRREFDADIFHTKLHSITDLLDLQLEKYKQRSLWKTSAGELRRLILSIALALDPKLLILDEPTISMSHENTRQIAKIFSGNLIPAIICISHDYRFLRQNTQAGVYFDKGQVSKLHDWEELEQQYNYSTQSIFEQKNNKQPAGAVNS